VYTRLQTFAKVLTNSDHWLLSFMQFVSSSYPLWFTYLRGL